MFRLMLSCLGKYKKYALLGPLAVMLEVVFEVLIPRVMASIIDKGVQMGDTAYILRAGALMIIMALTSLLFGVLFCTLLCGCIHRFFKGCPQGFI